LKEDGLNEVSKFVETDDAGRGANRGIADEETDVLESPLMASPSDDPIDPSDTEGLFTEVRIVFLPLLEAPVVSLPRRD
jgi:hypothetical protein